MNGLSKFHELRVLAHPLTDEDRARVRAIAKRYDVAIPQRADAIDLQALFDILGKAVEEHESKASALNTARGTISALFDAGRCHSCNGRGRV